MRCSHANAPAHAYCVVCGITLDRCRCSRCGVINDLQHLFCFACGQSLRVSDEHVPATALPRTYDLDVLRIGLGESPPSIEESSIRLTQDDIRNLVNTKLLGEM